MVHKAVEGGSTGIFSSEHLKQARLSRTPFTFSRFCGSYLDRPRVFPFGFTTLNVLKEDMSFTAGALRLEEAMSSSKCRIESTGIIDLRRVSETGES